MVIDSVYRSFVFGFFAIRLTISPNREALLKLAIVYQVERRSRRDPRSGARNQIGDREIKLSIEKPNWRSTNQVIDRESS